jgi:hypothetical protein
MTKNECNVKGCACPCHAGGCCKMHGHDYMHGGSGGAVYGFGIIGAAIYFVSGAPDFWMVVLGLLKAIVWPVFMVLELFKFLLG